MFGNIDLNRTYCTMNLHSIDLGKLHVFRAVHANSSVRGAATALNLTPSAISASLRSFEADLRVKLFTRTGRQLVPTLAAAALEKIAAPFLADLESFLNESRHATAELKGVIRVGLPANYAVTTGIPAIAAFTSMHPGVSFKVRLADTSDLIRDLRANHFDLIVCDDGPHIERTPGVTCTEVARELLVLACSPQFQSKYLQSGFSKEVLRRAPHVAYAENHQDLHKWYIYHFGRAPKLEAKIVIGDPRAVKAAVSAGLGLGILPISMITEELKSGTLIAVKTKKRSLESRMLLMRKSSRVPPIAERAFTSTLYSSK